MRRVWVLRRLSFLIQYWHWIFALNYNRIWDLTKMRMTKSLRWIQFQDMVKYIQEWSLNIHIVNKYATLYSYTFTHVYVQYNNFTHLSCLKYIFLAAVSDCQSRLYAILLFWFGWLENFKTLWKYSYISSMSIIHNG